MKNFFKTFFFFFTNISRGETALLKACRQGLFRIAEALVVGGANASIRNKVGESCRKLSFFFFFFLFFFIMIF